MKNKVRIKIPQKKIEKFCKKWKIRELSLFGSVLQENFQEHSDIDLLVTFEPEAKYGLFDLVRMQAEFVLNFVF